MSSIDERIVQLRFNNEGFERGIQASIEALEKLEKSLELAGATDGLKEIDNAAKTDSLDSVADSVSNISDKFNWLGAIGFSVLNNLTNSAMGFGKTMLDSILDPLTEGGKRRALNIEQAKFQFKGLGMDVEKTMEAALYAVRGTPFGLDEAAKAAASLGASQVPLERMGNTLRGISGVAALTGSDFSRVADIFTKVAGQGRLMGDDLNRAASYGMNAAATLAKEMGITEAEVRKMVTEGEISFEMFADAMDSAFGEHATKANETYSGSLSNIRAALSRIGAAFATSDFEKQRQIFNALLPVIDGIATALKPAMKAFEEFSQRSADSWVKFLNGIDLAPFERTVLPIVEILENVYYTITSVLAQIGEAFTYIFPPSGGDAIYTIISAIRDFTAALRYSVETTGAVRNTFLAIFSIFKVGAVLVQGAFQILSGVGHALLGVIGGLTSMVTPLVGFFASVITGSGEGRAAISAFADAIVNLVGWLATPLINATKALGDAFNDLLTTGDPAKFVNSFSMSFIPLSDIIENIKSGWGDMLAWLAQAAKPLAPIGDAIALSWGKFLVILQDVWAALLPVVNYIGGVIGDVFNKFKEVFGMLDFNTAILAIHSGFLSVMITSVKKYLDTASDLVSSFGGVITSFTGVLEELQNKIKADALKAIAVAIVFLAGALLLVSLIDSEKLLNAVLAVGVMVTALMAAMKSLEEMANSPYITKMPLITGSMGLLAIAVGLLANAVQKLSGVDMLQMAAGLGAVAVLIGALVVASNQIEEHGDQMLKAGLQMIVMAGAVNMLAGAVSVLSNIKLEQLVQGLAAMNFILFGLVASVQGIDGAKGELLKAGATMILISAALGGIVLSVLALGSMDPEILAKGLGVLAGIFGMLIIFNAATNMGSKDLGAELVGLSVSLLLLAGAIAIFGNMKLETIAQGMGAVAIMLGILAIATKEMTTSIVGAGAMITIAFAITTLALAIKVLGEMHPEDMFNGLISMLAALGGVLLIMGLAATSFSTVIPVMLAMAGAVALMGVGLMLMAGSVALLGLGLYILAPALTIATVAFLGLAEALVQSVGAFGPMLLLAGGLALFGAGALISAIGVGVLAVALFGLSISMGALAAVGLPGSAAIESFMKSMGIVFAQMGNIMIATGILMSFALAAGILSIALAALGVGMLASAVGFAAVAGTIALLGLALMLIPSSLMAAGTALQFFALSAGMAVKYADAIMKMNGVILAFGVSGLIATPGALAFGAAMIVLGAGLAIFMLVGPKGVQTLDKLSASVSKWAGKFGETLVAAHAIGELGNKMKDLAQGVGQLALIAPGVDAFGKSLLSLTTGLQFFSLVKVSNLDILGNIIKQLEPGFGKAGDIKTIAESYAKLGETLIPLATGLTHLGMVGNTNIAVLGSIIGQLEKGYGKARDIKTVSEAFGDLGHALIPLGQGLFLLSSIDIRNISVLGRIIEQLEKGYGKARDIKTISEAFIDLGNALIPLGNGIVLLSSVDVKNVSVLGTIIGQLEKGYGKARDLKTIAEAFVNLGEALVPLGNGIVLLSSVDTSNISVLGRIISQLEKAYGKANELKTIAEAFRIIGDALGPLGNGLVTLTNVEPRNIGILAMVITQLERGLGRDKEYRSFGDALKVVGEATKVLGEGMDKIGNYGYDGANALNSFRDAIKSFSDFGTPVKDIRQWIEDLDAALRGFRATADNVRYSSDEVVKNFGRLRNDSVQNLQSFVGDVDRLRGELGNKSTEIGRAVSDGVERGMRDQKQNIGREAERVGDELVNGMERGIRRGDHKIERAADHVARGALEQARRTLGIRSPSREGVKIGKQFDQGVGKGITSFAFIVKNASAEVGETAIDELSSTIGDISTVGFDEFDNTPVITPVVDMTNIEDGWGQINEIFGSTVGLDTAFMQGQLSGARPSDNLSRFYSAPPSTDSTPTKEVSFTQINNSPKALGLGEIYRQTKNQLSLVKEGVGL